MRVSSVGGRERERKEKKGEESKILSDSTKRTKSINKCKSILIVEDALLLEKRAMLCYGRRESSVLKIKMYQ